MTILRRRHFDDCPGWTGADHLAAFEAFRRSAPRFLGERAGGHEGSFGLDAGAFRGAALAATVDDATPGHHAARAFFESHFTPFRILPEDAAMDEPEPGFVTGYYEPVLDASPKRTDLFRFPLYARPDDLVRVDAVSRPAGLDAGYAFARRRSDGMIVEHPDRAAIEAGALAGRGLEIAWLDSAVDAFFVHVQGSARLRYPDGAQVRVGYAAKSGHPYTSIARVLIDRGELSREEADMAGLRAWLAAHPERVDEILSTNRSFIFFVRRPVEAPQLGPTGAAGVPLTPLHSLAVDDLSGTYGVPYFVTASRLMVAGSPFRQLMIAQDTGSAIIGPARGDIFVGSGDAAGALAGTVRHRADMMLLLPPEIARRIPS